MGLPCSRMMCDVRGGTLLADVSMAQYILLHC